MSKLVGTMDWRPLRQGRFMLAMTTINSHVYEMELNTADAEAFLWRLIEAIMKGN
jgi:hypothetical protein